MSKTVVSTFSNREQAEKAVNELRSQGFEQEISVIAKDENNGQDRDLEMDSPRMGSSDSVTDGATTGGALGGIAGLAAGAGALAIPGIGPLLAMGPIAGLLSGAAAGGLAGGLIDFGIPAAEGREYEEKIKQGHTLVVIQTNENRVNQAAEVLRNYHGENVKVHG